MTTERENGFKVLRGGRSCIIRRDKEGVDYHIGKPARPHRQCGPLCVFKTREAALDFIKLSILALLPDEVEVTVHKCTYIPSDDNKIWSPWHSRTWLMLMPDGTRLAEEVTIGEPTDTFRKRSR